MISHELINGAIYQWSKRLLLVICFQDGHMSTIFIYANSVTFFLLQTYFCQALL